MKTVENDRKNTYIGFGFILWQRYENENVTVGIWDRNYRSFENEKVETKICQNDRNMISLSVIDKTNNKLNYLIQTLIYINFTVVKH
jgi:hypothetical protein